MRGTSIPAQDVNICSFEIVPMVSVYQCPRSLISMAHLTTRKTDCPKISINLLIALLFVPHDSRRLISDDVCLPVSSIFPGERKKKEKKRNNGRPVGHDSIDTLDSYLR